MPINSAQELHDLVNTLGNQFSQVHQIAAHQLHITANSHIQHVLDEGGNFITNEIHKIHNEWSVHQSNIQAAEDWFVANGPHLIRIGFNILETLGEAL